MSHSDAARAARTAVPLIAFTSRAPRLDAAVHLDSYPTSLSQVRLQRVADAMLAGGMLRQPFDIRQLLMR